MSTPATAGVARPAVTPPAAWAFPRPHAGELTNGARTLAFDVPGQHVLSVRVVIPAPLAGEPAGLDGVGTLMARTLDEGTDDLDAEAFAELLERRGVAFGASVGQRGLIVDVDVPRRRLGEALELLRAAVERPAFHAAEVTRHQRSRLSEIEQERAQPGQRAAMEFVATFYDAGDRLALPTAGSAAGVAHVTPQDVRDYHAAVVRPRGATVVLAGDLDGLDVTGHLEGALGSWRGAGAAPTADIGGVPAADAARIVVVDRPGSVQSELYLGCAGPDRRVAGGWAPFPVLSYLVGGAPGARLDAVLREERGYTYGARSAFRPRGRGGVFVTNASVRADVTVEALELALEILEGAREGFDAQEAAAGIEFLAGTAPGRFATADAVAEEAVARALDGLGTEHTTQVLADLRTLTPERLGEAYREWIDGRWTIVVVGDAQRHADGLRALGRGPVDVVA